MTTEAPAYNEHRARAGAGWTELLSLEVQQDGTVPILQQVYLLLRGAIIEKRLVPGTRLPSTRRLADSLKISRTSVLSAYDQLLAEGYITGRAGSGTFVADDTPQRPLPVVAPQVSDAVPKASRLSRAGERFRQLAQSQGPASDVPFATGCCSMDAITVARWKSVCARRLRSFDSVNLHYSDPIGEAALRTEVAQYLRAARAVRCEPNQIIIVSGAQQALDLAARALLDPGDDVWIEDPGYLGARAALGTAGANLVPVPVDDNGLVVAEGIARSPRARAAYITPSHQYPTGSVMSMRRRTEILAWAKRNDAWIIEDDYDSEFRFVGRPLSSLQGIDDTGRVIYVGTLSKMLFPGIRLGFAVVPPELVEVFAGGKYASDRQPPSLQQLMVADFMRAGYLTSHIRRMRVRYREARDAVVEEVSAHLGDLIDVEVPECGIQLMAHFKGDICDAEVARQARRDGIVTRPVSSLYLGDNPRRGLLLGYAGFEPHRLRQAARRLAGVVRSLA